MTRKFIMRLRVRIAMLLVPGMFCAVHDMAMFGMPVHTRDSDWKVDIDVDDMPDYVATWQTIMPYLYLLSDRVQVDDKGRE